MKNLNVSAKRLWPNLFESQQLVDFYSGNGLFYFPDIERRLSSSGPGVRDKDTVWFGLDQALQPENFVYKVPITV